MNVPHLALKIPLLSAVERQAALSDIELILIISLHWLQKEMLLLQVKIIVLYIVFIAFCSYANILIATCAIDKYL